MRCERWLTHPSCRVVASLRSAEQNRRHHAAAPAWAGGVVSASAHSRALPMEQPRRDGSGVRRASGDGGECGQRRAAGSDCGSRRHTASSLAGPVREAGSQQARCAALAAAQSSVACQYAGDGRSTARGRRERGSGRQRFNVHGACCVVLSSWTKGEQSDVLRASCRRVVWLVVCGMCSAVCVLLYVLCCAMLCPAVCCVLCSLSPPWV